MSHESNRLTFVCLQYKTNKFQHQEKNFDFSLIFFSENSLYIMRAKIRLSPLEDLESKISESPATYNWPCRNPRSVSAGASRSDAMRLPKRESLMKLVGQEFVIIDDFGWPRNPDGYNKLVKRVAQKAGISDIHPHMFRHTFVSLLMSNPDIGVATVAAEAGHAQPSTTLMIYTQQYKKRRESIRNQLSRELYEK